MFRESGVKGPVASRHGARESADLRARAASSVTKSDGSRKPAILFGSPKAPRPKGDGPLVLAGGERRTRIPCNAQALRDLEASASDADIGRALRIIDGTNLDDHHLDDVLRFGADLQLEHGTIAEAHLDLTGDETVAKAQDGIARALELLRELDPEAVFAPKGSDLLDSLASIWRAPEKADERLAALYPELLALAEKLETLEPGLASVSERLEVLRSRYQALDERISSYVLAARFLIQHMRTSPLIEDVRRPHYLPQANALETRIASLLNTQASSGVGRFTLDAIASGARGLLDAVRGLREEDLPAWHTNYAVAIAASRSHPPRDDQSWLAVVRGSHERLVSKLMPKG